MLRQKSRRPTKNSAKIGTDIGRQSTDVARFSQILLAERRPTVGLGNVTVVLGIIFNSFTLLNFYKFLKVLCLAHIKIYDRAIKILSVSRPIYQVLLSQIGRRRAFTLKICTAYYSWELFFFASDDGRAIIGRRSDDRSLKNTCTYMYMIRIT